MTLAEPLSRRRGFLVSLLALALAGAFATGLVGTGHDAAAHAATSHHHAASTAHTAREAAFHDQMRKLWEDHVTWTRLAIVTFADGSGGFDATAARLLQNQVEIGNTIEPFYGDAAGAQLTALLREHILIAVDLMQAAKAGDTAAFQRAHDDWYANADEIADFLATADPVHWPQDAMREAMRMHLDQTLAEASHELGGQYAASVADYEEIHHHILAMADVLSDGLIRSFPQQFN